MADDDIDYVLMMPVEEEPSFENFDDPTSVASQIARGRGRGKLAKAVRLEDDSEYSYGITALKPGKALDEGERVAITFEEGRIKSESGFVMRFVQPQYHHLSVADISQIPSLPSYPVPESAIASLPKYIVNRADENEHVKFQARYDEEQQEFSDVELDWESEIEDPMDALAELLNKFGRDRRMLDYFLMVHGPDGFQDQEAIAEAGDIEPETVSQNVREIGRELTDIESEDED
jgi:hypothetical protein